MIGSRMILLPVGLWGVLKIVLVQADLTDVLLFGRLAAHRNSAGNPHEDTSRFPPGVLTMAEGSPLVTVRSPNRLQQGFARTVSSPASPTAEHRVGWPQAKSPDLPMVDRVIPARVRKGEGRPKISTSPGVTCRSSNETFPQRNGDQPSLHERAAWRGCAPPSGRL